MLYINMGNENELIEVKFIFQSIMNFRHPMFRIKRNNPYFEIFFTELANLKNMSKKILYEE